MIFNLYSGSGRKKAGGDERINAKMEGGEGQQCGLHRQAQTKQGGKEEGERRKGKREYEKKVGIE